MELFHFDPITLLVLIVGIIGGWYTLKTNSTWQGEWIKKHDQECDDYKKQNGQILTELKVSNERLTQIASFHGERLERIEARVDTIIDGARP